MTAKKKPAAKRKPFKSVQWAAISKGKLSHVYGESVNESLAKAALFKGERLARVQITEIIK